MLEEMGNYRLNGIVQYNTKSRKGLRGVVLFRSLFETATPLWLKHLSFRIDAWVHGRLDAWADGMKPLNPKL